MDGKRFDSFARFLVDQPSRRVVTGGIATGALGAILSLFSQPDAEANRKRKHHRDAVKKRARDNDAQVASEKKRKKKKVTLCQNGQTIKVSKKAKKKFLRQGASLGPCADTPACTPNANACAGRLCGSVDNGCGAQIACGPNNGVCTGTDTCDASGQCVCTPNPNVCAGRECGVVNDGCGQQVPCGANNGACTGTDFCDGTGACLPVACQGCVGCCSAEGTCLAGSDRETCGHSGRRCKTCGEGVNCVNGECTCSNGVSCGQGCCTIDGNGQPFCDNSLRPCGDTCIPKEACCTGNDSSIYQSIQAGCLPNETCVVNSSGFGECRCGTGGRCDRNQGCCTEVNGQATCDDSLRPCGGTCISRGECCSEGQATAVGAECDNGVSCTSVTCRTDSGSGTSLGICEYNETPGACPQACAAGYGYGNEFPEFQREVRCGSVNGQPCYCWRTTEGENRCTYEVAGAPTCRENSDCGNGEVCMRSGLVTGSNYCARICQ